MSYQVDTWAGDVHQNFVSSNLFDDWDIASSFMKERMDEGALCNVLHTDFKAPSERIEEAEIALSKYIEPKKWLKCKIDSVALPRKRP